MAKDNPDKPVVTKAEAAARTRKLDAETESILANMQTQIIRQEAEARKFLAEASRAEAEAAIGQIMLDKERRDEEERLASNRYHHTYVFGDSVNSQSVKACMDRFDVWDRTEAGCDVTLIFNSPGGDVISGMALFDYLTEFRSRGHKLTTVAMGYAASMAGILLQAGEVRAVGRESYLLIHEVSFGASGKIGEIEDEVKFVKMIQNRVLDIFAARAKVSRNYIATQWRRKDWWLDSDTALRLGIVDCIRGLAIAPPKSPGKSRRRNGTDPEETEA
jgi:ATP-dependent Clp endopeptidase proteolytic subunit ClpP